MKKIIIVLLFIFCTLPAYCIKEKLQIRVGISNQNFSSYNHNDSIFTSNSEITLINLSNNTSCIVDPYNPIEFKYNQGLISIYVSSAEILNNSTGPFVMQSKTPIYIKNLKRKGKSASYEGQIQIILNKDNSAFNIVNVLSMNAYLKGVVPNEMPVTFGLEALKAQAVAARNYANRDIYTKNNYDICDSVACQVYFGSNTRHPLSDRAVDETNSIFVIYNNKPALTLYHSTAGGITESWDKVWGNPDSTVYEQKIHPYLSSKGGKLLTESDVRKYYGTTPKSYDMLSPKYRWKYEFSEDELINVLNCKLPVESAKKLVTPVFSKDQKITEIKEISVQKRGYSGKALLLKIDTDLGIFNVKSEGAIRRIFNKNGSSLPSANFFIDTVALKIPENEENPSIFNIFKTKIKHNFIIIGGGFGHGVGMSQYGAYYLAKNGLKYNQILKYYYTGTTIGTLQYDFDKFSDKKIVFYYDPKSMKHIIFKLNNKQKLNNFQFEINGLKFNPNMNEYRNNLLWFSIEKYLKQGKNEILIKKLSPNDINKKGEYWLEIVGE